MPNAVCREPCCGGDDGGAAGTSAAAAATTPTWLGKFSFFLLPPPSITVRCNFVDDASVREAKKKGKGGEISRKKHVVVGTP